MEKKDLSYKMVLANMFLLIVGAFIRFSNIPSQAAFLGILFVVWLGTVWLHVNATLRFSEVKP